MRAMPMHITEFFVYSHIGWLYEVILTSVCAGRFVDRGFLHLPICPIYGFFGLVLLAITSECRRPLSVFALSAAAVTAGELICSYALEAVLGYKLWDYSAWPVNFDGRISLISSIIFGLMGLLAVYIVHPAAMRLSVKAEKLFKSISALCIIASSADLILCIL